METRSLDRMLAILATFAALTVAGMAVAILATKGSQDFFQTARPVEAYGAYLSTPLVAFGLRLNLGLDNLFMLFYGAFFIVLSVRLRDTLGPSLAGTALAAVMLTVVLDSIENHHIMTMVHSIQNGLPLSVTDGQLQMIASQVKFHASYLAVLLFSFGFLQLGKLGRIIAIVLWCYIPCGVLISVIPVEQAKALVLGRTIFFVFAFILSAVLFFSLAKKSAPAPSSQNIA
ncbi:hypothetical protein SAMN05444159_3088 [Bradyrhizobium lablabi]|uniref:DUF4386 domain-containing protein n=1 Tax=Bradyrhizobium lablabi TaxID=722472 RepID=A0A1M6RWA9_9BRAD|nr:hypothetical protein [Bradyrhizobium lablabi]SHK36766.1 hypothetical protein SAMN05444159_3088 [Bradyrhizobium lablabi]